jgi:UDP-N-acetylglucosamine 2-epimerase (non-hydrolysing)
MKTILVIFGTRPEAIKLAPIVLALRKNSQYKILICNTEQQRELSNQTLSFFGLKADFNLDAMLPNQTLAGVQSRILSKLSEVFANNKIDLSIVQGDTMTTFCGALASFYNKVPVCHVEAGLRSYNLSEPFPEEAMRQTTARITALHFAPTQRNVDFLIKENIKPENIFLVGNTVIDALFCLSSEVLGKARKNLLKRGIIFNDKLVLITVHRRENHGHRLDEILKAIKVIAEQYNDHQFVLPVHPNPNVKNEIYNTLAEYKNIVLTEPLTYPKLVAIMQNTKLILTDSGGIQEEAPSFGNPVLVMRYETERQEGVEAGFAKLVGADYDKILKEISAILDKDKSQTRVDGSKNPYGNGKASDKIVNIIDRFI